MEMSGELQAAIGAYQGALQLVMGVTQESASQIYSALTTLNVTAGDESVASVEDSVEIYLEATDRVRTLVVAGLTSDPGGIDPRDAYNRLAAGAGGDFLAAHQLVDVSSLDVGEDLSLDVESIRAQLPTPRTSAHARLLVADVVLGLQGGEIAGGAPLDRDLATRVETACDSILTSGGKNVEDAFKLLGLMQWSTVEKALTATFGAQIEKAVVAVIAKLKSWFERLRKAAVRILHAGLEKLRDWLGRDRVDHILEQAKDYMKKLWDDVPGGNTAAKIVGGLVERDQVVESAEAALASLPPTEARMRVACIEGVAASHATAAKYVGWGISVLGWTSHWVLGLEPEGPALFAGASLLFALVSIWLVQDRLDAPGLSFFPDLLVGVEGCAQGK